MQTDNTKIIRFIPYPIKDIFHLEAMNGLFNSTFIMRSLFYYKNCENNKIQDSQEAEVYQKISDIKIGDKVFDRERTSMLAMPSRYLISSWSLLENENDVRECFNNFCEKQEGLVIISTITKVKNLIARNLQALLGTEFKSEQFIYQQVDYYPSMIEKEESIDSRTEKISFRKKPSFSKEKEYRFCYRFSNGSLDTIIFLVKAEDYIDQIVTKTSNSEHTQHIRNFCRSKRIECCVI